MNFPAVHFHHFVVSHIPRLLDRYENLFVAIHEEFSFNEKMEN